MIWRYGQVMKGRKVETGEIKASGPKVMHMT
jgi:hypothetical protein